MLRTLALLLLLASPARADVAAAVAGIGAGYTRFVAATQALAGAATLDCDPAGLLDLFHGAQDAWLGVAHIRLGPVEKDGRALAIAFWPDPKGLGAKAQRGLLTGDPALLVPARFAEQSVAARGLTGLERLLFPAAPPAADPCPLLRATADDLARMATEVQAEWPAFARDLLDAGNGRYLTEAEARQSLFTQLATALEFTADQRLGRPLATFDKPRPERAEARASARSQRNVALTLATLRDFAVALEPDIPETLAAFDRALSLANALDDPALQAVATPQGWLKADILRQSIHAARDAALAELAPALGVGLGFNAMDGD